MIRELSYKTVDQAIQGIVYQASLDQNLIKQRFPFNGDLGQSFNVLKKKLIYTDDPVNIELIQRPRTLLSRLNELGAPGRGDCDDFTTLAVSYALGHDIPVKIAIAGNSRVNPSHVYAVMYDELNNRWRKFDLTAPGIDLVNQYRYHKYIDVF